MTFIMFTLLISYYLRHKFLLMHTLIYSVHPYEQPFLEAAKGLHTLAYTDKKLNLDTASLARGYEAVAIFTSDDASAPVLEKLHALGVRQVALRSVGFDHVDLHQAKLLGMQVANVPEYSPYSVAEHAVALLMASNRKLAESRLLMQLQDFRLDNLTGFDIHGKTVGIVGTGKIGMAFASIMHGFGANILACDPVQNPSAPALGIYYVSFEKLLQESDVISIHCPLNANTRHLFSREAFMRLKPACTLINTSRGAICDTEALLNALENGKLGAACLDVYEGEKELFFHDHRTAIIKDQLFTRLRALRNVTLTGHQAFLTREALTGIAGTTIQNLDAWERGGKSPNTVAAV
jgi:D-lactate dehydrogenase